MKSYFIDLSTETMKNLGSFGTLTGAENQIGWLAVLMQTGKD